MPRREWKGAGRERAGNEREKGPVPRAPVAGRAGAGIGRRAISPVTVLDRESLARLVHQRRVHCHVAHPAAAVELDPVPSHGCQRPNVTLVVDVPTGGGLPLLDAATAIEIPTHF